MEKNLNVFRKQDPRGAKALEEGKRSLFKRAPTSADSLSDWAKPLLKEKNLIIYGLDGAIALLSWLQETPNHSLLVVEESIDEIKSFLGTENGTLFFSCKNAKLLWVPPEEEELHLMEELVQFKKYQPVTFLPSPSVEVAPERYLFLRATWNYLRETSLWSLGELLDGGSVHFSNFYKNLAWLSQAIPVSTLFGAFSEVPAIIVGPGPSLQKNGRILQELRRKALIFSGGTGVNVLNQMGINPHFSLGIDPHKTAAERLLSTTQFEVPFLYKNRFHFDALWEISSPLLYIPSSSFKIEQFVDEKLGILPIPSSGGGNVLNQATQIALLLGCNPIIFVGVDLAYTHGESYAFRINKNPYAPEKIRTASSKEEQIMREDIYGKPIKTLHKWVFEAFWYGSFRSEHQNVQFLNATEGGLGFPGIDNTSLAEVVKQLPLTTRDFDSEIYNLMTSKYSARVEAKKITSLYEELLQSYTSLYKNILLLEEQENPSLDLLESDPSYPLFQEFIESYKNLLEGLKQDSPEKTVHLPTSFTYAKMVVEAHLSCLLEAIKVTKEQWLIFPESKTPSPPPEISPNKFTAFYTNGQPRSEIPLSDGLLDGELLLYWPNGKIRRKAFYRSGKREGSEEFFRPSGELFRKGCYRADIPYGKFLQFGLHNEVSRIIEYDKQGHFTSERFLDESGHYQEVRASEDFWTDLVEQSKKVAEHLKEGSHFLGENLIEEEADLDKKICDLSELSERLANQAEKEHELLSASPDMIDKVQKRLNFHTLNMNAMIFEMEQMIASLKNPPAP